MTWSLFYVVGMQSNWRCAFLLAWKPFLLEELIVFWFISLCLEINLISINSHQLACIYTRHVQIKYYKVTIFHSVKLFIYWCFLLLAWCSRCWGLFLLLVLFFTIIIIFTEMTVLMFRNIFFPFGWWFVYLLNHFYLNLRSSHQKCFVKIGVLKNFAKFVPVSDSPFQ